MSDLRPALRRVLAALVALDLVSFVFILGDDRRVGATYGALNAFNDAVSRVGARVPIALLGLAAAVAFTRRAGRFWAGLIALGALAVLSTAHAQLFGSPWRHLYFSGLCLAGWLLGLAVSRARGAWEDESFARMGSLALLGAAYLSAGVSKLAFGGLDWLWGLPIRAAIVAQDGLVGDSLLSVYRTWIVETPAVAGALAIATVGFELAGPLMIVGGRLRVLVALGLFAMHANIFLLMPILYWQSMVLLLVFGLSSDGPGAAVAETAPVPGAADTRRFAIAAGLLALCAVLAIGHQARRYARWQARHAAQRTAAAASPPPAATPPVMQRSRIGPFAIGQTVVAGWTVEAVEIRDGGFVATLSGPPGRPHFAFTCAASPYESPFDVGALHIFYAKEVSFDEVETVGRALQQMVRTAAAGRDVCEALADWRAAAEQG